MHAPRVRATVVAVAVITRAVARHLSDADRERRRQQGEQNYVGTHRTPLALGRLKLKEGAAASSCPVRARAQSAMVRCTAVVSVTHPWYAHMGQVLTTTPARSVPAEPCGQARVKQLSRRGPKSNRPGRICLGPPSTTRAPARKPGPSRLALMLCYGVTFPKSMNIVPAPSVSVNEYPNPAGHVAPPCGPGGKVWCHPDWISSHTVYVPAGKPVNE